MVTHRLEAIREADRVLTLAHGTLLEDGPYGELMAARGPLYQLLHLPGQALP
jgi:ABC-type multidrug transport system fused ATPase/permease subunit